LAGRFRPGLEGVCFLRNPKLIEPLLARLLRGISPGPAEPEPVLE